MFLVVGIVGVAGLCRCMSRMPRPLFAREQCLLRGVEASGTSETNHVLHFVRCVV